MNLCDKGASENAVDRRMETLLPNSSTQAAVQAKECQHFHIALISPYNCYNFAKSWGGASVLLARAVKRHTALIVMAVVHVGPSWCGQSGVFDRKCSAMAANSFPLHMRQWKNHKKSAWTCLLSAIRYVAEPFAEFSLKRITIWGYRGR